MSSEPDRRKVLIIEDDASARDTMRVLLGSMWYQCVFASNVKEALAVLEQENPVIAIFDPQPNDLQFAQLGSDVGRIIARFRGRVIIVTGDTSSSELSDLIKRYSLPHIPRGRLVQELWTNLESLLNPSSVLRRVTHIARLTFDSYLQPLPAGVRISRQATRRFVYECGSLSADVSFEPQADSRRIELVGQILDSTNPDRRLEGIPVVLQGRKGPIALAMTNELGEFRLDFDFEAKVTVELETSKNHWVTLVSPSLEWVGKAASAGS